MAGRLQTNDLRWTTDDNVQTDLTFQISNPTPPVTITNTVAGTVPFTIVGAAGQTADYLDITASGGAAGGVAKVDSTGLMTLSASVLFSAADKGMQGNSLFNAIMPSTGAGSFFTDVAAGEAVIRVNTGQAVRMGALQASGNPHSTLALTNVASSLYGFSMVSAASGSAPTLSVIGTTNLGMNINGAGTGGVTMTAQAASAVPLSVVGAAAATGDFFDITYSGGTAGNMFKVIPASSSTQVDGLTITTAATANPANVQIGGTGSDSNVDLSLVPKGTGVVNLVPSKAISGAGGAATLAANTNGATGPAGTAQVAWLQIKVGGTISYLPYWQ